MRLDAAETTALLQATADIILVLDRAGKYVKVHSGRRKQLYRDARELLGRTVADVLPPASAALVMDAVRTALDTREIQRVEYSLDIGGEELFFSGTVAPASEHTVVWLGRDITEQRENAEALRASDQSHRDLLASLPVIAYWVSPRPPYEPLYVSPGVERLGYTADEWMSFPDMWLSVMHPDDRDRIVAETEAAAASASVVEYEYRVLAKDGSIRWMHDRGIFIRDSHGETVGWRGVMFDVTERRALEERLAALSEEDELTGLLNRRGFRRMAEQALNIERRGGGRASVVYIDLDDFKPVNDQHGHATGDEALRLVAKVLRQSVRAGDVVARLGGDEFVILAVDAKRNPDGGGETIAERFQRSLAHACAECATPALRNLGFTHGVVDDQSDTPLDELLARADDIMRLRKAKRRYARLVSLFPTP